MRGPMGNTISGAQERKVGRREKKEKKKEPF
jgi:hypothetical protein